MSVMHFPGRHPYVEAIDPAAVRRPDHRDDPWVHESVDADIAHVHFGFEHLSVHDLERWITSVRETSTRLVVTVHDIDNPHLTDQSAHHARTRLLVERADAVVTLTPSAADDVERRWGVRAEVIPHPPLVRHRPAGRPVLRFPERERCLIWLGTLRPNIDLDAVAGFLAEPAESDTDTDTDTDIVIRDAGWDRMPVGLRRSLSQADARGAIHLRIVDRPDDRELEDMIARSGALVLPYAWGTHSGLVELATDLGVPTVTTSTGCRHDQGAIAVPAADLAATAQQVLAERPIARRHPSASLDAVRRAHRRLYASCRPSAEAAS